MNITIENKKQKAIELMNKLDIYKPYIKGFKDKNSVCFYENFGGFWAYQEPELMAKIKEFEEKYRSLPGFQKYEDRISKGRKSGFGPGCQRNQKTGLQVAGDEKRVAKRA